MQPAYLRLLLRLTQMLHRISALTGRGAAWLTIPMVLVATSIVIARLFDAGSIAAQEVVLYLHATVLTLASAYTLQADGHVRVDIFYRRLDRTQRAWINSFGAVLFLLPMAVFTLAVSLPYVAKAWNILEGSADAGGLPAVYLLKSLMLATSSLLILQALALLIEDVITLTWRNDRG